MNSVLINTDNFENIVAVAVVVAAAAVVGAAAAAVVVVIYLCSVLQFVRLLTCYH
jgi:hypothetical protein